jgi:hypothetical protein
VLLHVLGDIVTGLGCDLREADDGDGARGVLRRGTEHVANEFGSVHFWFDFLMASLFGPCAEETAENYKFAQMVSGVVGYEESFAEQVLAVAPAEGFKEVGPWVLDEGLEVLEVGTNGSNGLVPCSRTGWQRGPWPVVLGPLQGLVAAGGWRGEVQDVALSDAEVFEKLPGRVWEFGWYGTAKFGRKVFQRVVEGDVGLAAAKKGN